MEHFTDDEIQTILASFTAYSNWRKDCVVLAHPLRIDVIVCASYSLDNECKAETVRLHPPEVSYCVRKKRGAPAQSGVQTKRIFVSAREISGDTSRCRRA